MGLYLFDIDRTLLKGLGPYDSSLEQAIKETFQAQTKVDLTPFHGLTDRRILRNILGQHNIPYDEVSIERCLHAFGKIYPETPSGVEIIPGVPETLSRLAQGNQLGIVTGNVEEMARKKLRYFKINENFPFGGFGNEAYERSNLVNFAILSARNYGWNGDWKNIFLVGDTPRDVEAALFAGVNPVAVTTGTTRREELIAAGARRVIDNLAELLN